MTFTIRNKNNVFLIAILMLAAALRLYKCDFQNLWLDEVLTMNSADPKLTLKEMYDSVMHWEYIPHLYFFLNRILFEIFGFSTLVARVLSAVIGVCGVYAIYLLGKEIFSRKAGLIAALLLAVNVFHISYSQEARPYGMLFLFSVLSFYRLVVFIKKPTVKNAVYYGIFTGLIVNAHFFGVITIFSQSVILLYFLSLRDKEERITFFKNMLIAGGVALLFALPATEPFIRVSGIDSFWAPKPAKNVYSSMFQNFLGDSEILIYCIQAVILYYVIRLFRQKLRQYDSASVQDNKLIFSSIILFAWLFISIMLPFIKSHLGASMMLNRYFISILAILLLIIAIGLSLIKNKPVFVAVVSCLVFLSLTDVFVVKDYYNTLTKTQYKEFAEALKENNPDEASVVTFYAWILPYYFQDKPQTTILNNTLEMHLEAMKSGTLPMMPFWYVDFNSRPYKLSAEGQAYLDDNFVIVKKLEFYDIWGNYYVPKNHKGLGPNTDGYNYLFYGTKPFFENGVLKSKDMHLTKGDYKLIVNGLSTPAPPIKGENAHFKVLFNGKQVGEVYLSEKNNQEREIIFKCPVDAKGPIELVYDNDIFAEGKDRNATIYSVRINKVD